MPSRDRRARRDADARRRLIFAAIGSIRVGGIQTVFRTGRTSQIAIVTTFLATLFLTIPQAVGIGVALSLLLQLNKEALDLAVVRARPAR